MKTFSLILTTMCLAASFFLSGCATTAGSGEKKSTGGISAPTEGRQDLYEMHNRTFRQLAY